MLSSAPIKSSQFVRFIVVGAFSTAINYGLFYILYGVFGLHYEIASALGFIVGLGAGFPFNKNWTYAHGGKINITLMVKYLVVYLASLCLGLVLLGGLVSYLLLAPVWANIAVIGVTTCTNFIGTKLWVFRR